VSIDKSLKRGNRLARARNVLKRHERIEKLATEDRWDESQSVLGLPKTKVVKTTIGKRKKKKKEEEEGEEAAATDAT
jgi:small basic protein (TIGR04137 family)